MKKGREKERKKKERSGAGETDADRAEAAAEGREREREREKEREHVGRFVSLGDTHYGVGDCPPAEENASEVDAHAGEA